MDRPDNAPEALRAALGDIRLVNRLLGGRRVLLAALEPFLEELEPGRPVEILDIGTGGADLPLAMLRQARRRGRELRVTAIDRDSTTAAMAAQQTEGHPEIRVLRADAFRLPFPERSFDIVTASMFLHHYREAEVARLLADWRRMARCAVVINDLRRHWLPWAFVALASRLTRRHPLFVHDAALSVLRGFTAEELRRTASGVPGASIRALWPFRLVLTLPAVPEVRVGVPEAAA